jgi:hypothetical protein
LALLVAAVSVERQSWRGRILPLTGSMIDRKNRIINTEAAGE